MLPSPIELSDGMVVSYDADTAIYSRHQKILGGMVFSAYTMAGILLGGDKPLDLIRLGCFAMEVDLSKEKSHG